MLTRRGFDVISVATGEAMLRVILGGDCSDGSASSSSFGGVWGCDSSSSNSKSDAVVISRDAASDASPQEAFSAVLVDRYMPGAGGPCAIR